MKIFFMKVDYEIEDSIFYLLLSHINPNVKKKIERKSNKIGKINTLYSYILLQHINSHKKQELISINSRENTILNFVVKEEVEKDFLLLENLATIEFTKNGKPYFVDENFHFSISHIKGFIAIAVSRKNVGLDILEEKNIPYKHLMTRAFDKKTQEKIKNVKDFISFFTIKEAIVKEKDISLFSRESKNLSEITNKYEIIQEEISIESTKILLAAVIKTVV